MKPRLKDVKASSTLDVSRLAPQSMEAQNSASFQVVAGENFFNEFFYFLEQLSLVSINYLVVLDSAPGFGVQILSTMDVFVASWENWDALSISYPWLNHGWTMLNPFAECKKCKKNLARLWPLQIRTWISMIFWRLGCTTISFEGHGISRLLYLLWFFECCQWCCMTVGPIWGALVVDLNGIFLDLPGERSPFVQPEVRPSLEPESSNLAYVRGSSADQATCGLDFKTLRSCGSQKRTLWDLVTLEIDGKYMIPSSKLTQTDPENHLCLMETSLRTPTTARVYVNVPEGNISCW